MPEYTASDTRIQWLSRFPPWGTRISLRSILVSTRSVARVDPRRTFSQHQTHRNSKRRWWLHHNQHPSKTVTEDDLISLVLSVQQIMAGLKTAGKGDDSFAVFMTAGNSLIKKKDRTDSFGCAVDFAPLRYSWPVTYNSQSPRTTCKCLRCCALIPGRQRFDRWVRWLTAKNPWPMTITMLEKETIVFFWDNGP